MLLAPRIDGSAWRHLIGGKVFPARGSYGATSRFTFHILRFTVPKSEAGRFLRRPML
jgi:hypothetical protein